MARMNFRFLAAAFVLALSWAAQAQEQAFTNRSTELKERGAAEARTLGTLPENTEVKVITRGGGWTQVEAGAQKGWVRVFHLRFPAIAETSPSAGRALSGVSSGLGLRRKTSPPATNANHRLP